MFSNDDKREILARIDALERLIRLQGEAHSAIMNQVAATQEIVRKEAAGLHERISFNRRPLP